MQTEEHTPFNEARTIIISVLITVLVITSLLYIFRNAIITYVFLELEPEMSAMVPLLPEITTNEERVVSAIAAVNPAVVSVVVTKDVPVYEQYFEVFDPVGPFGSFTIPRVRENGTEEREIGGGSGFIVSSDGFIVTNRHVVDDPEARYSVILADGSVYGTTVVDRDLQLDIAILQISELPEEQLPVARFGDSSELQLGQTVVAIGNALAEFQNSVSVGVVSGLSRSIVASDTAGNSEQLNQVIQTDAAINPGNSGGPLLNTSGEVIGVNVATSQGADNIGFALPSSVVERVVDSIREYGEIVRPFLGVRYVMLDEEIQEDHGLPVSFGAIILDATDELPAVVPDSPAAVAGLQAGDIILAIDGSTLFGKDLATELRNKAVGEVVILTVLRAGIEETVPVELDRAL